MNRKNVGRFFYRNILWMVHGEQAVCCHWRKNSSITCNKVKTLHEKFDKKRFFTTNKDVQKWILSERVKIKILLLNLLT